MQRTLKLRLLDGASLSGSSFISRGVAATSSTHASLTCPNTVPRPGTETPQAALSRRSRCCSILAQSKDMRPCADKIR
eukprot:2865303-Prymnesium_polylepis.1